MLFPTLFQTIRSDALRRGRSTRLNQIQTIQWIQLPTCQHFPFNHRHIATTTDQLPPAPSRNHRDVISIPNVQRITQLATLRPADVPKLSSYARHRYQKWRQINCPRFRRTYTDVWLPWLPPGMASRYPHYRPVPLHREPTPEAKARLRYLMRLLRREPNLDTIWKYYTKIIQFPDTRALLVPRFFEWFVRILNVEMLDPDRSHRIIRLTQTMLELHSHRFPSNAMLVNYLNALIRERQHAQVVEVMHRQILQSETERGFPLTTRIINCYLRSLLTLGKISLAQTTFQHLLDHPTHAPDEFTYTYMIRGLCRLGMKSDGFRLYRELICRFPHFNDTLGFNFLLHSFASLRATNLSKLVLREMVDRVVPLDRATLTILLDLVVQSRRGDGAYIRDIYQLLNKSKVTSDCVLLEAFARNFMVTGNFHMARHVIDRMRRQGMDPSTKLYETMVHQLVVRGRFTQALGVYHGMLQEGIKPTDRILAYILNGYTQVDLEYARSFYEEIRNGQRKPSVTLYNGLICSYARLGHLQQVLNLFHTLIHTEGLSSDLFTYYGIFQCFCNVGMRRQRQMYPQFGNPTHSIQDDSTPPSTDTFFCFAAQPTQTEIDSTSHISTPYTVYRHMLEQPHVAPTVGLYASILKSLVLEGDLAGCDQAYVDMTQYFCLTPDDSTYSALIFAFLQRTDVDHAADIFAMLQRLNLRPTLSVCNALIRGFFRADRSDCALELFQWMVGDEPLPDSASSGCDGDSTATQQGESGKYRNEDKIGEEQITHPPSVVEADPSLPPGASTSTSALFSLSARFPEFIMVSPDEYTFDIVIKGLLTNRQVDLAHEYLQLMQTRWHIAPPPSVLRHFIKHYTGLEQVLEATSLIREYARAEAQMVEKRMNRLSLTDNTFAYIRSRPLAFDIRANNASREKSVENGTEEETVHEVKLGELNLRFDRTQPVALPTAPAQPIIKYMHPVWAEDQATAGTDIPRSESTTSDCKSEAASTPNGLFENAEAILDRYFLSRSKSKASDTKEQSDGHSIHSSTWSSGENEDQSHPPATAEQLVRTFTWAPAYSIQCGTIAHTPGKFEVVDVPQQTSDEEKVVITNSCLYSGEKL
ncbi:hypothetical protein IWQ61_005735 [Dispira simplex]|nr:hypothetical protein IWQ61_005735 [Dispira simplex]